MNVFLGKLTSINYVGVGGYYSPTKWKLWILKVKAMIKTNDKTQNKTDLKE